MAKKQVPQKDRKLARQSSSKRKAARTEELAASSLLDAVAEIVHQGFGFLLDANELRISLTGWKPNCCANYEYEFVWNSDFDIDAIEINWNRPSRQVLRRVVKQPVRMEKILNGSPMTKKEQQAYRLEIARQKHGYQTAQERLESGADRKWVDLSYLTDSKGRSVYILEMGDADTTTDEDMDAMPADVFIGWLDGLWQWKNRSLEIYGPFGAVEEAEKWMAQKGAFDDDE